MPNTKSSYIRYKVLDRCLGRGGYSTRKLMAAVGEDLEMPLEFGRVPWKHHVYIFTHCKSIPEALFYIDKTIENGWSRSELEAEIDDDLYSKQSKAVTNFDEKLPLFAVITIRQHFRGFSQGHKD